MQLFLRIRHFSIYRKIIFTYILLVTVSVLVVSSVLFSLFSSSTAKEIDANSRAMLAQTSYTSDVVYNQVKTISDQITIDNRIISFFYSADDDKIKNYNASLMLGNIVNVYPFVSNIEICNLSNNHYYNTLDGSPECLGAFKQNTLDLLKEKRNIYMAILPRKLKVSATQDFYTISFILFPEYLTSSNNALLINIDEKYIQNTIRSMNDPSSDFSTFVIDSKGIVLSHTDSHYFMEDFSKKDYVHKILNGNKDQGSFTQTIEGKKQLVTYVKSKNMDWYFISLKPYDQLLQNLNQLRDVTVLTGLFLIVAGILISWLLTGNIYNPIKSLMDKVKPLNKELEAPMDRFDEFKLLTEAFSASQEATTSMKYSIEQATNVVKEKYLLSLLKGNISDVLAPRDILAKIQNQLTGPVYRIFVLKIDGYQSFKENTGEEDRSILRFALCNIAQELLEKHCKNDSFITEEDEIVLLGQFTSTNFDKDIILSLAEIQDAIKNYYNFTVSIGIGDAVQSINQLSISCKSAQEYVKYRLFYGYECIMDHSKVKDHNAVIVKYPNNVEKKLIESLQLEKFEQVQKYLAEFVKSISRATYYQAINYSNQLVLALFKNYEDNLASLQESYKEFIDNMNELFNQETLSCIHENILDFYTKTLLLLKEKNSSGSIQKHIKIIEEVKSYVLANYSDPGLSLDMAADKVGLSASYLGKIFKNVENISFSDYIINYRLKKAGSLLTSTNEPTSRICKMVGIYNITYFSTLFKKIYGLTPTQYRDQAAVENP